MQTTQLDECVAARSHRRAARARVASAATLYACTLLRPDTAARIHDALPVRGSPAGLAAEAPRTGADMSDSIEWLGGHCFEKPMGGPGMRGGVSLTAVRGLPSEDLLRRMGAGDDQIGVRAHYRDFDPLSVDDPWTPCMYGTSGEWSYVLEDSGVCAWYQHWADGSSSVMPHEGEEFVCLYANAAVQPSWLFYAPGEGGLLRAEFRHTLTGPAPAGESDRAHAARQQDAEQRRRMAGPG